MAACTRNLWTTINIWSDMFDKSEVHSVSTLKEIATKFRYLKSDWLPVVEHLESWQLDDKRYSVELLRSIMLSLEKKIDWWEQKESEFQSLMSDAKNYRQLKSILHPIYSSKTQLTKEEEEICKLIGIDYAADVQAEQKKHISNILGDSLDLLTQSVEKEIAKHIDSFDLNKLLQEAQQIATTVGNEFQMGRNVDDVIKEVWAHPEKLSEPMINVVENVVNECSDFKTLFDKVMNGLHIPNETTTKNKEDDDTKSIHYVDSLSLDSDIDYSLLSEDEDMPPLETE